MTPSEHERARLLGNTSLLASALSARASSCSWRLECTLLQVDNIVFAGLPLLSLFGRRKRLRGNCLLADFLYRAAVHRRCHRLCRTGPAGRDPGLGRCGHAPAALYIMSVTFGIGAIVHASKLRVAWPDLAEARLLAA